MSKLQIDFLQDRKEIEQLEVQWDELCETAGASPYSCFDWFLTGLNHFDSDDSWSVGVVRNENRLIGIVPLRIKSETVGPTKQPAARFAGGWLPRSPAALSDEAAELAAMEELLAAHRQPGPQWTYGRFVRVPQGSPMLVNHPERPATSTAMKCVRVPIGKSVVIGLPESWEAYYGTLSKSHKKTINRRTNALQRKHEVKLVRLGLQTAPDPAELNTLIEDALTVSKKSWQGGAEVGSSISDSETVDFFIEVSQRLASKGKLELSVLYADDKPISFIWGAASWPRSTIAKLGFDPDYSKLSPGTVHLAKLIRDSIERGGIEIDFGHEFVEFKSKWSKQSYDLYEVMYYPPGIVPGFIRWWRHGRKGQTTHGESSIGEPARQRS